MIKRDKIKSHRVNKFAIILGEKLFPQKKDTIINALQLETGSKEEESKTLANAYIKSILKKLYTCLLYTSPSPRDGFTSRMPSSA